MQELPILEHPTTVLHLIQNLIILFTFILSIRWGWKEFRIRGKAPGRASHNPGTDYHIIKSTLAELRLDVKDHGKRIARIEGRLNGRKE